MEANEYVRLEVAENGSGGKPTLVGYFPLEPNAETSNFRTVDDYLFALEPHKSTFHSSKHGTLCSRYAVSPSLVGVRLRETFLKMSLQPPGLEWRHRLEVEACIRKLHEPAGAKEPSRPIPTNGKEVSIKDTEPYWSFLESGAKGASGGKRKRKRGKGHGAADNNTRTSKR